MNPSHLLQSNLINIPSNYFASPAFNKMPWPVHINGVREMNKPLFDTMDKFDLEDMAPLFMEHMRVMFELDAQREKGEKRKYRSSYLRLIRGWFFDSNNPEAAVMKGWAESRFGVKTLFHKGPLTDHDTPSYMIYLGEKMHGRYHNNSIYAQLDLLYEYSQYYLERFGPARAKFKLYRGLNDLNSENQLVEKEDKDNWVIRNNSLCSFSKDYQRATEFGDTVIEVDAPFAKVLCFPELLDGKLPDYEAEHILIGGDFHCKRIQYKRS